MELALARTKEFEASGKAVGMVSHGDDRGLHIEFFIEDVYQPYLSNLEGRAIYKQVEKIRVRGPASKSEFVTNVFHPAPGPDDQDKAPRRNWAERFPAQYKAFKAQQAQIPDGTPLEMCKFLASHRVKELKAADIHTAEQYALMPDAVVAALGMGAAREKKLCQQFLASDDQKVAEVSKLMAENTVMQNDLQMLKDQLAQLNASMATRMAAPGETPGDYKITQETLETVPQPAKRGPGRPPKEITDEH